MRKSLLAITVLSFAVGGSGACATKRYVNTQVGQVSGKVDTLSQSLEADAGAHASERGEDR